MKKKASSPGSARPEKGAVSEETLTKYANVLIDSVFKKIFGTEKNKDMMIALIEQVLPGKKISGIKYTNTVQINPNPGKHDSVFDVECTDAVTGERFDVEIQKGYQPWFPERALYYSSFMIGKQLSKGKSYYKYPPVYVISLVNFELDKTSNDFIHRNSLRNDLTNKLLTDRLNLIFLELPKARSFDTPGVGILEKTCYAFHNMTTFDDRPEGLQGKFFEKLFDLCEIANFAPEERAEYEKAMNTERDIQNQIQWAREEGLAEGMEKKAVETAKNFLSLGVSPEIVSKATGIAVKDLPSI